MSGEIEVSETPNWLKELEAKRERRLKAKLGHETGAGAPCLKCGDKCPGLDLHFWRKCCKICKCAKEEHEVQDDDIYGWAQFQLLGSKPNKIKMKIVLPGKKDELELDWAPKGHNDTVDKYLKTLPPEQLPVKGSQAAQDRKQLLQKQIPVHDIDPSLCHELTEDELNQMNEYIAHIKKNSVGVGQIINLSSLIKGSLHMLNPSDATIIASRYPKGIPLSEIVKLQSQVKSESLKHPNISENLQKMNLNDNKLPSFKPVVISNIEENQNAISASKIHDRNYPIYSNIGQSHSSPLYTNKLKPIQQQNHDNVNWNAMETSELTENSNYYPNTNFDPKKVPSQFINQQAHPHDSLPFLGNYNEPRSSAFVPYVKTTNISKPEEQYSQDIVHPDPNYTTGLSGRPRRLAEHGLSEKKKDTDFNPNINYNYESQIVNSNVPHGDIREFQKTPQNLPTYVPGKYNTYSEAQSPTKIPKNVRDLAFSTYDLNPNEIRDDESNVGNRFPDKQPQQHQQNYIPGNPFGQSKLSTSQPQHYQQDYHPNSPYKNNARNLENPNKIDTNISTSQPSYYQDYHPNSPYRDNTRNLDNPNKFDTNVSPLQALHYQQDYHPNSPYRNNSRNLDNPNTFDTNVRNMVYDPNSMNPGELQNYPYSPRDNPQNIGYNAYPTDERHNKSIPHQTEKMVTSETYPREQFSNRPENQYAKNLPFTPNKESPLSPQKLVNQKKPGKLSEMQPSKLSVSEDFLHPNQVIIGAIQDINYPEIKAATHGTNDFYEDYSPNSIKEILNNIKLPDCHYCKKPFEENEFAISIERANALFHAECFRCAGCNQILADNVYFYSKETDNIYCGRDYAKIRGFPRCNACDELIFTKEYCLAENSTFHLKHFCCTECDTPLAGQDYTLEEGMPYCLPCFEHSKANKCNSCNKVIKPDEVGCNLNGVHFHADDNCFSCSICRKPLMGMKLLLRNQKLYCSHECFGVANRHKTTPFNEMLVHGNNTTIVVSTSSTLVTPSV